MNTSIKGVKLQNWHRPLGPFELSRKVRRNRLRLPRFRGREFVFDGIESELTIDIDDDCGDIWIVNHRRIYDEYGEFCYSGPYVQKIEALLNPVFYSLDLPSRNSALIKIEEPSTGLDRSFNAPRLAELIMQVKSRLNYESDSIVELIEGITSLEERLIVSRAATCDGAAWSPYLVNLFAPFWIRSPGSWKAGAGVSLVDHLFVKYRVPAFLYSCWSSKSMSAWTLDQSVGIDQIWFIELAQGGSLKQIPRILSLDQFDEWSSGWRPTGKFQQNLYVVPAKASFARACGIAEMLRVGATPEDARRLWSCEPLRFNLFNCTSEFLAFWRSTVLWIAEHGKAMNDQQCQLILAWAHHEYTEARRDGRRFRWTERRFPTVLARAIEFERSLSQKRSHYRWEAHGWDCEMDDDWSFRELINSYELDQEGRAMRHCVGGYAWNCVNGSSAIVSLQHNGARQVTLEVSPSTGELQEARGKCNREATAAELEVIQSWLQGVVRKSLHHS